MGYESTKNAETNNLTIISGMEISEKLSVLRENGTRRG
jgi:hypothetical protein